MGYDTFALSIVGGLFIAAIGWRIWGRGAFLIIGALAIVFGIVGVMMS